MNQPLSIKPGALELDVDLDIIQRMNRTGPRYTSYPSANHFHESFTITDYRRHAQLHGKEGRSKALSLYFHLPFCNTLCWFCGCNKVITNDRGQSTIYVDYLLKEIAMQRALFGDDHEVRQIHWGGGTPTFLPVEQMRRLMHATREYFNVSEDAEISIEIDPRRVEDEQLLTLGMLGFNRISVGVQDFNPKVQKAVNRKQSVEQTSHVIETARRHGTLSVNMDLIYGLSHQTVDSFSHTLDQVLEIDPDRLSVYNYAHMPALFKPQRMIKEADLPSPETKLQILQCAINKLLAAGYVFIGMDHFAKADDELAIAQRHGQLQRNFQGYSTHAGCDLVAMGISAIGKIGPTYSQNVRDLDSYYDLLDKQQLPIMRGLELNQDDLLRRHIIHSLMCHFCLSLDALWQDWRVAFQRYFVDLFAPLNQLQNDGLLTLDDHWLAVTPKGRLLIRNICMVFDAYLSDSSNGERLRYSKVI